MNFSIWFETWPLDLQIAFLLAPFIIGLSGVAIGVYIACSRHFNIMLSALPNSAWAKQQHIVGTTSFTSRFYLVGTLSGALLLSNFNVRKGVLDATDVGNFPLPLRRLMTLSTKLACVGMAWLCGGWPVKAHWKLMAGPAIRAIAKRNPPSRAEQRRRPSCSLHL